MAGLDPALQSQPVPPPAPESHAGQLGGGLGVVCPHLPRGLSVVSRICVCATTCLHRSHETARDWPCVTMHSTHAGTVQTALARPDSAAAPRRALTKDEHGKPSTKDLFELNS